ncbi:hypothetical protein UFOVP23_41 [uncultured Caudovirales phage]|uniref:Uncharacterized protein n=1 Tax=uncultured Caudovirales phage TaxID=2100421 RepID=A0A6J5T9U9_9CAUD|nr:hypothetical protein UFOVP23_41 [uncultured Caudovirales phage]
MNNLAEQQEPENIEEDAAHSKSTYNVLNYTFRAEPRVAINRPFVPDAPPEGSTLPAAFRRHNTVGNYINTINFTDFGEDDPDFNYEDYIPTDLWQYGHLYATAKNKEKADALTAQLRSEERDAAILHNRPWYAAGSIVVANVLDPTILMPGGAFYKELKAAHGVAKSALAVSAASMLGESVLQAATQHTQLTKSLNESFYDVLAAGIIGAGIGSLGGAVVNGAIFRKGQGEIVDLMADDAPIGPRMTPQQSVSAMETRDPEYQKEINSLYGGTPTAAIGKFLGYVTNKLTPQGRMLFSPFATSRAIANEMFEHNLIINANLPGTRKMIGPDGKEIEVPRDSMAKPIALESEIKMMKRGMYKQLLDYQDIFYEQAGIKGAFKQARAITRENKGMKLKDWETEVWRSVVTGKVSDNPSVKRASDLIINNFFEPIKNEYIRLGVFPADIQVKTAANYFMRVYNRAKIRDPAQRVKTKAKFEAYIKRNDIQLRDLEPQIKALQEKTAKISRESDKIRSLEKEYEELKTNEAELTQKAESKFNAKTTEVVEVAKAREVEFDKFKEAAEAKIVQAEKELEQARVELENDLEQIRTLKSQEHVFSMAEWEHKNKNLTEVKEKAQAKINVLKKNYEKVKQHESYKIKEKERKLNGLINYQKKELKEAHDKYFEKVKRLKELEDELKSKSSKEHQKEVEALEKELKELVPFHLWTSTGEIRKPMDPDYYGVEADKIIDNILGMGDERNLNPILRILPGKKTSPLHERAFLIDDTEIEDELITAFSEVGPQFINATVPNIAMMRYAERLGLGTEGEAVGIKITQLTEDYKAAVAKNPAKEAKLHKRYLKDKRDIEAGFDILNGVYGMGPNVMDDTAATFIKNLSAWNYLRFMGQITLQAITDVGAIGLKHGLWRTMAHGLIPVLKEIKNGGHDKNFLKDLGFVCNTLQGYRLKAMMDQESLSGQTGLFTRSLDYLSSSFGNATLMNQWTDAMEFIAGKTAMARTLRAIVRHAETGKISRKEKTRLNEMHISEQSYAKIYEQYKKHGGKTDGSYWVDWSKWDEDALESLSQFKAGTLKEIDQTVVSGPGAGEKPLWSRRGAYSLLFQFKGFSYAMTNKGLISGLQRGDAEFYQGLAMTGALALMGYVATAGVRGEEIDLSYDNLFKEMVDRSGITGVFGNAYNVANKLSIIPGKEVSRYRNRGFFASLGGPSVGMIEDTVELIRKLSHSEESNFTTNDMYKFMRMWPYQNYAFLHRLNKIIGKNFADSLGFEESP